MKVFNVPDVSCQHCVNAITKEVSSLGGVRNVQVDLNSKQVSVDAGDTVPTEAINEAGYEDVTVVSA